MADQSRPQLAAEPRVQGKKSEVRQLRLSGQIPGLVYGHGDPRTIKLNARTVADYLRHHAAGGILELKLLGDTTPVLIREIDRDPISGHIIHLGFQRVDLRERLKASIPLEFIGEDSLVIDQLVMQRQMSEIEVHGRADRLPESIQVDVTGMTAGTTIRIADLQLPAGIEPTKDAAQPVASITMPSVPADVEAALEAEEAARAAIVASHGTELEDEEEMAGAEEMAAAA